MAIDPDLFRDCPERYAREPWLQAQLEPEERVAVQGELVRRYLLKLAKTPRVVPMPPPKKPALSGQWAPWNSVSRRMKGRT